MEWTACMHGTTSYRVHLLRQIVDFLSDITEANLCIVIHSFTPLLHEFYAERPPTQVARLALPESVSWLARSLWYGWGSL